MKKTIVVVQTAFLGDLILTVPFLQRLKKKYPEYQLVIVCKKGLGSFLKKDNIVDKFFEIEKSNRKSYKNILNILNQKQDYQIDYLFCIHRSVRSLLFSAQLKAQVKIGYRSMLSRLFLNQHFIYPKNWPAVIRTFQLLQNVDSEVAKSLSGQDWAQLNQANSHGVLPEIANFFKFQYPGEFTQKTFASQKPMQTQPKRRVAIFPGSVWATKRWTQQGFQQLIALFIKDEFQVDLMGGPDERTLCEELARAFPQENIQNFAGRFKVEESIEHLKNYHLVVANDSAATHMAALQQIPSVTIFGPTTLNLGFRPWSDQARVVENKNLNCRPCGLHGHNKCPLGHHRCMTEISSEQVYRVCMELVRE